MYSSKAAMTAGVLFLLAGFSARATLEPAFCDVTTFEKTEIASAAPGLQNNHAYQLGNLVLVGLAIGRSDVTAIKTLADRFGQFSPAEKSCTWYFNNGNSEAINAFNYRYVSNPMFKGVEAADEFEKVLASSFADDPTSFMSCAIDHHYIAMGCDGMKHRGPSVFAMVLAYAGCTPQHATAIANKIWGTNGVFVSTREAIANKGKILGDLNPSLRDQLQVLMSAKN